MEAGDLDAHSVKRLRLDSANRPYNAHTAHNAHAFPPPPPPPQTQSVRHPPPPSSPAGHHHPHHQPHHHPHPHPHLSPHGLPPPASSYPPGHHYPHPPPSSLPPSDPRAYPESTASRPAPSPRQLERSNGFPVTTPQPSISQDRISDYPRPPVPPRSTLADAPAASSASVDVKQPPTMDPTGHAQTWQPPYDHRGPNGAFQNGHGRVVSPDHVEQQFPTPPLPPGQQYSPPVNSYTPGPTPQPPYMGGNAAYAPGHPRRKQVRATQACNNCRQRKQKCDEAKPCSFCKDNNFECLYKEVPPPKQDRTMMQLQDTANELKDALNTQTQLIGQLMNRLQNIETTLSHARSGQPSPLTSGYVPGNNGDPFSSAYQSDQSGMRMQSQARSQSAQLNGLKSDPSLPIHSAQSPTSDYNIPVKAEILSVQERNSATPVQHTQCEYPKAQANGSKIREEASLKSGHTTPAHIVLQDWPSMKEFCDGIQYFDDLKARGILTGNYPMRLELERGIPRVWGVGQGLEVPMEFSTEAVATPLSYSSDAPSPAVASPTVWGPGDVASPTNTALGGYADREDDSPGGLGPDGRLKLDSLTLSRLHASYMDNIHALQPILNPTDLRRALKRFGQRYGSEARHSQPSVGYKRRRSGSIIDDPSTAPDGAGANTTIHRSIENAIVLLVLALGKASEWKKPLPRIDAPFTAYPASGAAYAATPPEHLCAFDGAPTATQRQRNIDRLPGMAYYTFATDILGNQSTGLTVMHGQAWVLAGLYCAQFGRVLESWTHINKACTACTVSIKANLPNIATASYFRGQRPTGAERQLTPGENTLIQLFWACFQLEGDLLAELSTLEPSPLSGFREDIAPPQNANPDGSNVKDENVLLFHTSQNYLRKILNDAQNNLYYRTIRDFSSSLPDGRTYDQDSTAKTATAAEALKSCLERWRDSLKGDVAFLNWRDSDPPATEINHARLRGKYYGGTYMILRPYLYILLHHFPLPPGPAQGGHSSSSTSPAADPYSNSSPAIRKSSVRTSGIVGLMPGQERMLTVAAMCVDAAIQSTIAFDRVGADPNSEYRFGKITGNRLIVTNPFGTLHAQFGNMIVLAAVYKSKLRDHVCSRMPVHGSTYTLTHHSLSLLFDRTIKVLKTVDCPALEMDALILENIRRQLGLFVRATT